MPSEQIPEQPGQMSRRTFIEGGLTALGSAFIGNKMPKIDSWMEDKEQKDQIKDQIEKCTQIIQNEQYEKILGNPYLVSALYYSPQAIKEMAPPHQNASEKIIWTVSQLITKQFRENYVNFLQKVFKDSNADQETSKSDKKSLPLDNINWKGARNNHRDAIDLFIEEGSRVYSISDGVVVLAENNWNKDDEFSTSSMSGGNTVIIFNPKDESFYRYAHMSKTEVPAGMVLPSGYIIGIVGHTGINASRPGHGRHLHLEINKYDKKKGVMVASQVSDLEKRLKALQVSIKN